MTVIPDLPVERPQYEVPLTPEKPSWSVAFKRARARFSQDDCTDKAAALTYYAMQSIFPGLIALLSLIDVFGNGKKTTTSLVKILASIAGKQPKDLQTVTDFINNINTAGGGIIALVVGIGGAIWSASGYVGAFGRALNQIYDIGEGRPFIRLRPVQLLVTVIDIVLIMILMFALTTTGKVATSIASEVGIPSQAVTIWDIAKWPFVVLIVVFLISLLYWATPNVRKTKRMLLSWGALVAFVVWVIGSVVLLTYFTLTNGSSYTKTYGIFAGAIMFLLWLWITNLAMLFGAELDAELIRTRQLRSGMPAEEMILLPARDESGLEKKSDKQLALVEQAYGLRAEAERETESPGSEAVERFVLDQAESREGKNPYGPDVRTMRVTKDESVTDTRHEVGDVRLDRDDNAPSARKQAVMTPTFGDPAQQREQIEKARSERSAVAVAKAHRERVVRDRLAAVEAKAAKKRAAQEKKRQEQLKASEEALPRSKRWEAVEAVRAQFAPRSSRARDEVEAERSARRAEFEASVRDADDARAAAAQKAPAPLPADGSHVAEDHELPQRPEDVDARESASRAIVDAERTHRREEWYATHQR
ncbi:YihY/virulence factor BrkB family protein [Allobranchiibius huperziae]|uniref:YihY family inner membrane protein n=1 Tax=Allobranchiibius huperziae TaxID=1874116 RepID=A0A853DKU6_9MICO|nr:YihY/virulence factor BrkB family protein [Allobranchiibius huperziae]NYJ75300.1 YihY family inner membrane protein [Allobranchiibius huperziae]